jgi:hypothetical protein
VLSIKSCALPERALLGSYNHDGVYTDCYVTEVPDSVALAEYVTAFYTSPVFKLERMILEWMVSWPATDTDARQVAEGLNEKFAAWHVECRDEQQLLLSDFWDRTRSWFMVVPRDAANGKSTALYFGSAVVPYKDSATGQPRLGAGFRALLGFHKFYSVVLLYAAKQRLEVNRA